MKVYVTGTGVISPLGQSADSMFANLLENKSAVQAMPEWSAQKGLRSLLGAPVGNYDINQLPRTVRRTMSRMSEMAALATFQALNESGLSVGPSINSTRTLICMGSTSGSPSTLEAYFKKLFEKHGPEGQVGTSFFKVMNHSVAANVAAALNFDGALLSVASACSTSTQALIVGWEMIRSGLYDVVIAGGADELHFMSAAIFDIVQAASYNFNSTPELSPRPFHRNRDGLVVAEGAGVLILESEAHAKKRDAIPLAELNGGAYICDGTHMSQSNAKAMLKTMTEALARSGINATDVDYVNAHATGTLQGDSEESRAIAEMFGDKVPVSSLKGHLGHTLAACGALEAIASIHMIKNQTLISTRGLDEIDPDCATIQHLQSNRHAEVNSILSNNFAFGGINTSLLLSKI